MIEVWNVPLISWGSWQAKSELSTKPLHSPTLTPILVKAFMNIIKWLMNIISSLLTIILHVTGLGVHADGACEAKYSYLSFSANSRHRCICMVRASWISLKILHVSLFPLNHRIKSETYLTRPQNKIRNIPDKPQLTSIDFRKRSIGSRKQYSRGQYTSWILLAGRTTLPTAVRAESWEPCRIAAMSKRPD